MKIKMNFGVVKTIIISVVALVCLGMVVLDSLLLAGAIDLVATNAALLGVTLAVTVLIMLLAVCLLLCSRYTFDQNDFSARILFFTDKLDYSSVDGIKQNELTGELYVHAKTEKQGEFAFSLNLGKKDVQAVKDLLADKCSVVIESFMPEKKKKK